MMGSAALAVAAGFQPDDSNLKFIFAGNLILKAFECWAGVLDDRPTLEAGQVKVVGARPGLIKVFFTFQVHQVELVDQFQPFQ